MVTYFKSINCPDSEFYQPDEDVIFFNEQYVQGEFIVMFDECSQLNNGKTGRGGGGEEWIHGYIIPLHKKGDINNHEQYRGITLLSIIKFTELLCSENKTTVINLSMYICKSFEPRTLI